MATTTASRYSNADEINVAAERMIRWKDSIREPCVGEWYSARDETYWVGKFEAIMQDWASRRRAVVLVADKDMWSVKSYGPK